jgi:hypothetical protein
MTKVFKGLRANQIGLLRYVKSLFTEFNGIVCGARIENGNRICIGQRMLKTPLNNLGFITDHQQQNNTIVFMSTFLLFLRGMGKSNMFRALCHECDWLCSDSNGLSRYLTCYRWALLGKWLKEKIEK